jgi:large subunit ribosomal protein L16
MMQPKKINYKKIKKGKLSRMDFKANKLSFGEAGLKAAESGVIRSKQLEAARQAISRKIRKKGKVWIRVFPDLPVTAKPSESRMGGGKGATSHWVARVKTGTIIFELICSDSTVVDVALKTGGAKLPVKTKLCYINK